MNTIAIILSFAAICYSYPYGPADQFSSIVSPVSYGGDIYGSHHAGKYFDEAYGHGSQQILPDGSVIHYPQGSYESDVYSGYPWVHHYLSHWPHLGQHGDYGVPHLLSQIIEGEREILHQQHYLQQQQFEQQEQQEILQLQQTHQQHQLGQHQNVLQYAHQAYSSPLFQYLLHTSPAYKQNYYGVNPYWHVANNYGVFPFAHGGVPVPVAA